MSSISYKSILYFCTTSSGSVLIYLKKHIKLAKTYDFKKFTKVWVFGFILRMMAKIIPRIVNELGVDKECFFFNLKKDRVIFFHRIDAF